MAKFGKLILATLVVIAGISIPANAAPVSISGKVTATITTANGLSLVGTTVQLEKYDVDADIYTPIATATANPSPSPTSTNAPYKFENVDDGTYRVAYPLKLADVSTSKFAFGATADFVVADGKITVNEKPSATIPDLKLYAMGKFAVKAIDLGTGTPIANAVITLSGSFNGVDAEFPNLVAANAQGTGTFPIPAVGTYSLKIEDPSGLHQTLVADKIFTSLTSNIASPTAYNPLPGGILKVTVTSGASKVAKAVVHLLSGDEEVGLATADEQGLATLKGIAPGDLTLWVGGPQGSPLRDSTPQTVTIEEGLTKSATVNLVAGQTISGTVSTSDGPLAYARVDVQQVDADGNEIPVSPAQSGDGKDIGKYVTNGLSAGTYNLYFYDESSARQDFRLAGSILGVVVTTANISNKNVTLPAAAVVSGKVTNADGANLANTAVELVNSFGDSVASTITDSSALYRFTKVVPGAYFVKFTNENYRTAYSPDFIAAGDALVTQDIELYSGSGIAGKVTSAKTNAGLDGISVSVYSAQGSGLIPVLTTLTQADGTYTFSGLPAGAYRVKFDGSTSEPATGIFWLPTDGAQTNAKSFGQAGDVITRPGKVTNNANPLPVFPWETISGTVLTSGTDDNGDPITTGIENATVTIISKDGLFVRTLTTDPDGKFSVSVPDNSYGVKVAAAGFSSGYVSNNNGAEAIVPAISDAALVTVKDGSVSWSLPDWDINLTASGGSVKVTVTDETGAAVSDGVLTAYDRQGNAVAFTDVCDDTGSFVLAGLPANGKFTLSYDSPGEYAKRFVGGTASRSDAGTVVATIKNAQTISFKISTVSLPTLNLKLVTSTGANAPAFTEDVTVEIYSMVGGKWTLDDDLTTTTNDGTAAVGVTNGASYRIRILPDSFLLAPIWVGAVPMANTVDEASIITIPAVGKAQTLDPVVVNLASGIVRGKVVDSFGESVSNAQIQLTNSNGVVLQTVSSREDGAYNIYRALPGTYSLRFIAEGFAIKFLNNVAVTSGQTQTANMTMNSASGVTGVMYSTDDKPVVGATASIYSASGSGVSAIQVVTTQIDGSYNFIGLVPGAYKIRFDGTTADVPTSPFWYGQDTNVGTFKDASTITTKLGEYVKNVDPQPSKSWALIRGTILDSASAVTGAAVSLVTVALATLTGKVIATDLTDENGSFALYAPDGSYQIQVKASGFAAGFIDATEGGDVTLSSSAAGAAVVSVADNVAQIDSGLKADDLTLDLAGAGGSVTVTVKDDSGAVVTSGQVTAYDSTGNIAGFADGAQSGVFTISGLSGIYRLSYLQDGVFAKTFLGGTSDISDPKTTTVTVSKTAKPSVTINVKTLPKLTVNVVNPGTPVKAFTQPVSIEVYSLVDGNWVLNDALSANTSSGSLAFGVSNGDQYRIRVVPNSDLLTPVWVGAARLAKNVSLASTITIPKIGAAPVLGNVVMDSAAGVIQGMVTNGEAAGIPNARVELLDNSGAVSDLATTRDDGGYQFTQIIPGTYTLKFVADGYALRYVKQYQVSGGARTSQDVQLTPATGISGRVLLDNPGSDPVVGANVSVYAASGTGNTAVQTVQTDAEGNYNFIGLSPGSYKIYFDNSTAEVPADSFWYGQEANVDTFKLASSIRASLGSYTSGIDPVPASAWTLFTGNIHDGQWAVVGGAVSLVSVSLIAVNGNNSLTGITDEQGNFAIYAPDGAYRIKVAAPGYSVGYVDASEVGTPILSATAATAAVLFVSEGNLSFDSGLTNTALSLDLGASGGKVVVTIKDELGNPVTDGVVSAYDKTGKVVATDDHSVGGAFTIAGLRGFYRISYQQDGVFAETFFGDTNAIGAAGTKVLTITDGANLSAAIKVKTLPKLTINIYSAGTTAYKQPVTVEIYSLEDGQWVLDSGLTQETSDGVLTVGVANLNQYRIRIVPANPALSPVWVGANPTAPVIGAAKSILIPAAGAVPSVSALVNISSASISGAVTDSFADVMSNVEVDLLTTNGDLVAQTFTLEDGTYTFGQVVPGTYNFRFSAERFADKFARNVVVGAGQLITQNAELDSASGISGRVLGSGLVQTLQIAGVRNRGLASLEPLSIPVSGATVGLYLASGNGLSPVRTEVTDENGYYNFSGLVPGNYRIRIDGTTASTPANRVWYLDAESNSDSFAGATTVSAVRGELATEIDPAPLKFWTAFDGLLKAGSNTIAGATVTLSSSTGAAYAGQTDADGFISVYVPDGDYRVQIVAPGYPGGFVSDTESGVILDPLSSNATLVHVADGMATFTSGLDLMADPLDLASIGGTLQVQVFDGPNALNEGLVKVYDRAGNVVAYTESVTGGVFTFDGLRGEYKVSYEQEGSYALTFVGGTKALADPATAIVKVRDKTTSVTKITAIALPKFTVSIKSGTTTYAQPATVNVYQLVDKKWHLQEGLGGVTLTGSYTFGVTRGESYRVQVTPDDVNMTNAWVGSASALSIDSATTYTVPATGNAPVLPAVTLAPAVQVTAQLKNSRPVALENVVAHVGFTQNNKVVEFESAYLGTLESGSLGTVTLSHVPVSIFPITVTGTSSNSAEVSWTSASGVPSGTVTTDVIEFNEVAIPASLTGSIKTVDGAGIAGQTVVLTTDEGDQYDTTTTDDSGNYVFSDLPLGVHLTVSSDAESGFLVATGDIDFTARSGDALKADFEQHYSVSFGGTVYDADGSPRANALVNVYRVSGTKLDIVSDDYFSVYTDESGAWTFDGAEFGAEVGTYAFFADGLDSDFTPAYLGDLNCTSADTTPEEKVSCATAKSTDAALVITNKDKQSISGITLSLGAADTSAPTGVKITKAPLAVTTVAPVWQWVGKDSTDGSALRSEVVIATAEYGKTFGAWSDPIDVTGSSYSITGVRGTTYCLAVRMIDKSGNASAYTAPTCSTVAMDDTAMKPAKATLWSQVAVKGSFLGKVTAAKKNSKSAVLNVTKAAAGNSLCIYYVTGAKFGSFTVTVNGKKLGKPVATAGKAGQIKSICYVTKLKANSKIAITVPKAGNGVQIDGYAITIAKPSAPVAPAPANLKLK
ncbi:MAG: carboxypeptidase regulatory-like domain-containing protein [Actinomycetales bacterium]|nr:carboxypeptidase regulatory-like domain-containing protein [Actinomycetales bacterium]